MAFRINMSDPDFDMEIWNRVNRFLAYIQNHVPVSETSLQVRFWNEMYSGYDNHEEYNFSLLTPEHAKFFDELEWEYSPTADIEEHFGVDVPNLQVFCLCTESKDPKYTMKMSIRDVGTWYKNNHPRLQSKIFKRKLYLFGGETSSPLATHDEFDLSVPYKGYEQYGDEISRLFFEVSNRILSRVPDFTEIENVW